MCPVWMCMSSQLRCKTKGGEGAHMNRVHGRVDPVRSLFQSTQCLSCMKEYFTAAKLKAHVLHSTFCRRTLIGTRCRYVPLPGSGSTADGSLAHRHDRLLPPQAVFGPIEERRLSPDFDGVDWDLHDACCLDIDAAEDFEKVIRHALGERVLSWTTCRIMLHRLGLSIREHWNDDIVLRLGASSLTDGVNRLTLSESWSFLTDAVAQMEKTEDWGNWKLNALQ